MASADSGRFWYNEPKYIAVRGEELDPVEKQLRDLFVREYLYDRDRIRAAKRCGFADAFAKHYADQFWGEPYVQQRIREEEERIANAERADQDKEDEKMVRATLRELLKVGSTTSRVSAAAKMAVILGMDAPTKSEQTVTHRGGVMAIPAIADINQWEEQAARLQAELAQAAKS